MDLSINVQNIILNIRVAIILKTPNGFLFEKHKNGYFFLTGGRAKINESSQEAAQREVLEEIEMQVKNLNLYSVMENFFTEQNNKVHEICFVYKTEEIFTGKIPEGFIEISGEDLNKYDIKPKQIVDLLIDKNSSFKHVVIK